MADIMTRWLKGNRGQNNLVRRVRAPVSTASRPELGTWLEVQNKSMRKPKNVKADKDGLLIITRRFRRTAATAHDNCTRWGNGT